MKTKKNFKCNSCKSFFSHSSSLQRHRKSKHLNLKCDLCGKTFYCRKTLSNHFLKNKCKTLFTPRCLFCFNKYSNKKKLDEHLKNCNFRKNLEILNASFIKCPNCEIYYNQKYHYNHIKSLKHITKCSRSIDSDVEEFCSALRQKIKILKIKIAPNKENFNEKFVFSKYKKKILKILNDELILLDAIRVKLEITGVFHRNSHESLNDDEEVIQSIKSFNTSYQDIYQADDIDVIFDLMVNILSDKLSEFSVKSSGWSILSLTDIYIHVYQHNPLLGGIYIDLPMKLKKKNCIINIKNQSNNCFLLCVAAYFYKDKIDRKNVLQESSYTKYFDKFNLTEISNPMKIKDIKKFEKNNENLKISINVYSYNIYTNKFGVLKVSETIKENHINLLLLYDDERNIHHFTLIESMSRLLRSHITRHNGRTNVCYKCLRFFDNIDKFNRHLEIGCKSFVIETPKKEKAFMCFKKFTAINYNRCVFYADIEALNCKISSCENNKKYSYTQAKTLHQPFFCCYYVKLYNIDDNFMKSIRKFTGINCVEKMIESLIKDITYFFDKYMKIEYKMSKISKEAKEFLLKIKKCHICKQSFKSNQKKVFDHDHFQHPSKERKNKINCPFFLGNIISVAHNKCNILFRKKFIFPVIFHNFTSYDSKFILCAISKIKKGKLSCISQTKEKYISISLTFKMSGQIVELRMIDSFKFLPSSLSNLTDSNKDFPCFKKYITEEYPQLQISENLIKKQFLFYDYLTDIETIYEKEFPSHLSFFNYMKNSNLTLSEYNYAYDIYKKINCKNLLDYIIFYTICDVLLLCDIFEYFRSVIYDSFTIDPSHFFTLPSLSLELALYYTQEKVPLLTDVDMINFILLGVRGGVCGGNKKLLEANHQHMRNYNPSNEYQQLIWLDVNSLYPTVMLNCLLPFDNFKWLNAKEIEILEKKLYDLTGEEEISYIVRADILYPENLHDKHKNLPFLPDRYQMKDSNCTKLIPTLLNKYNYVCHISFLTQALKHGLVIKKISLALSFTQKNWLSKYIQHNLDKRKATPTKLYNNIYKNLSNMTFGKLLESKFKQNRFYLFYLNDKDEKYEKKIFKKISSPLISDVTVFSEDLIGVSLYKERIFYDRPSHMAMTILDKSKVIYYNYYYDVFKSIIGENNYCLNFYDTDCYLLSIYNNIDFYSVIKNNPQYFDTSSFIENNKFGIDICNKGLVGLLKDETNNHIISRFVYLKPKCYAIKYDDSTETKKAKGVVRFNINNLTYDDYIRVMENKENLMIRMTRIASSNLRMYTFDYNKIGLSGTGCSKRYFDSNDSLPYGHFTIKSIPLPFKFP